MLRRVFAPFAVGLTAAVAFAAPAPKAPPPTLPQSPADVSLATARVRGQFVEVTETRAVPVVRVVTDAATVDGRAVQVTRTVLEPTPQAVTVALLANEVRATGADGKAVPADELAKRLGDGAAVVLTRGRFDPAWRAVFADDVLFIADPEPVPPPGAAVVPTDRPRR